MNDPPRTDPGAGPDPTAPGGAEEIVERDAPSTDPDAPPLPSLADAEQAVAADDTLDYKNQKNPDYLQIFKEKKFVVDEKMANVLACLHGDQKRRVMQDAKAILEEQTDSEKFGFCLGRLPITAKAAALLAQQYPEQLGQLTQQDLRGWFGENTGGAMRAALGKLIVPSEAVEIGTQIMILTTVMLNKLKDWNIKRGRKNVYHKLQRLETGKHHAQKTELILAATVELKNVGKGVDGQDKKFLAHRLKLFFAPEQTFEQKTELGKNERGDYFASGELANATSIVTQLTDALLEEEGVTLVAAGGTEIALRAGVEAHEIVEYMATPLLRQCCMSV